MLECLMPLLTLLHPFETGNVLKSIYPFIGVVFFSLLLSKALERSGAILFEGTEMATVTECLFERLDGNGIFLRNYNRNATLSHNEMAWIGGTAMAAWGSTGRCLDAECSRKLDWGVGPDVRMAVVVFLSTITHHCTPL